MTRYETHLEGTACWADILTSDPARTVAFYGEVFGWTADEPSEEFGGYRNFRRDGEWVAGCMQRQEGMPADCWSVYLSTPDIDATLRRAVEAGGAIAMPAQPVGDLGSFGAVADPKGVWTMVWQPGTHRGFTTVGEPNAPGWFDLTTGDMEASLEFGRKVFGWTPHMVFDNPEMRYAVNQRGEEMDFGVMQAQGALPGGNPGAWYLHLAVADVDRTIADIERLGGTVVEPATDTPFGRLAVTRDATGAVLKLVGPNEAMPMTGAPGTE